MFYTRSVRIEHAPGKYRFHLSIVTYFALLLMFSDSTRTGQ